MNTRLRINLLMMYVLACLLIPGLQNAARGQRPMPWRPQAAPVRLSPEETVKLQSQLDYTAADEERLPQLAYSLDSDAAFSMLQGYLAEYTRRETFTDPTWGAAVFSLGLSQTDEARDMLLALWDEYDRKPARGETPSDARDIARSVSPLNVIGDGLNACGRG